VWIVVQMLLLVQADSAAALEKESTSAAPSAVAPNAGSGQDAAMSDIEDEELRLALQMSMAVCPVCS
jgi:hypothetical protein